MSLINRIEVSCFLDSSQSEHRRIDEWKPDYAGVVFDVRGVNTIIAMENGYGKTSIVEAVLAVLSRDKELITRTRQRMAPKAYGAYSHIRVELLVQHDPSQDDIFGRSGDAVPGEKHVLGIYGNCDGIDPIMFYCYRGTISECPVAEWHGMKVTMVSNRTFKDNIRSLIDARRAKNDLSVDEWKDEVSKYFEREVVRQLVDYQKKGAGDVNAVFFKVSKRHGETFDSAFFYRHIAPELLVGVMGTEGEEDEFRFEQTVRISSLKVLEAMYSNRQEEKRLADINKVVAELTEVSELGRDLKENQNEYVLLKRDFATHAHIIKDIVVDTPLAGIPPSTLPENPLVAKIAGSGVLMLQNHEIYIIDKGLAEILAEEVSLTNQRATRNHIPTDPCQLAEVLEIPCNLDILKTSKRSPGSGHPNQLYTLENAVKLLSLSTNFALGWDKETAIASLGVAFDWAETNIYRRKLKALDREIAQYSKTVDEAKGDIKSCEDQIKAYEKDLEIIRDAQREYNRIVGSEFFTEREYAEPLKTRDRVESEISAIRKELQEHQTKVARLEDGHKEYLVFVATHGSDTDPRVMISHLEKGISTAQERLKKSRLDFERSSKKVSQLYDQSNDSIRKVEKLAAQIEKIQALLPSVEEYKKIFGNISPARLAETVKKEYTSALQEQTEIEKKLASYEQPLHALHNFRQKHNGDPFTWLSERRNKWDDVKREKMALEEMLKDKKARREDLERFRVAPGSLYRDAYKLAGNDAIHLYEAIESFGLEDGRRAKVMTVFSNFLFAPVFKSVDAACEAAKRLAQKEIEVPSFVLHELEVFCKDAEIGEIPGAAFSFFVGIRTLPVDCLLDSSLVENQKKALDDGIAEINVRIAAINKSLNDLDPQSADAVEAQIASKALAETIEDKQKDAQCSMEKIEAMLPRLQIRRDAEHLIRKVEEFVNLGGEEAMKAAVLQHEDALREEESICSQVETAKESLDKTKTELDRADDTYQKVFAYTDELARLKRVSKFLFEDDGVTFFSDARDRESTLEGTLDHAQRRDKFDFALAQNYVDYGAERVNEIEAHIGQLTEKRATQQEEIKQCEEMIKTCLARKGEVQKDAIWLDERASALISKYREVTRVIQEVGFQAALKEDIEGHHWMQKVRALLGKEEMDIGVRELYSELCRDVANLSAVAEGSRISELRKKVDTAKVKYSKAIDEVISNKDLDLKDIERQYLSEAKTDVSKIETMHENLKAELERRASAYEITKKAVDDARSTLAGRLDTFARRLKDNFDVFRKIAMFKKSEDAGDQAVGFEVTATMRSTEETEGVIEMIIRKIESDVEEKQKNRQDVSIFDYGKGEYEAIDDYIRDTFYRFMFLEPKIRVYFPSMKSGHPFRFDPDHEKICLSQGQRVALSLLWIIKFAEFAIEREARMQTSSPAGRRKLRAQKERVFIIDGLFSSLSSKPLIREALQSIAKIKGRFQMIGLVHNLKEHIDREIFPTYYIAQKLMNPGERRGIVIVKDKNETVHPESAGRRAGEIIAIAQHLDRRGRSFGRQSR